jgi:hypothetical protein
VRSDSDAVVVSITDVEPFEAPESVYRADSIHKNHGVMRTASGATEGQGSPPRLRAI